MYKFIKICLAASLCLAVSTQEATAYTVINFGPNGSGGTCMCYSLQDGVTPQSGQTPSFIAISACTGPNFYGSSTFPEGFNTISIPNGAGSTPLPPIAAGMRRIYVCGNPPGSTPMINYGSGIIYASYADVACPNGFSSQQVPIGQQPPWMSQFAGGNGYYPVCN